MEKQPEWWTRLLFLFQQAFSVNNITLEVVEIEESAMKKWLESRKIAKNEEKQKLTKLDKDVLEMLDEDPELKELHEEFMDNWFKQIKHNALTDNVATKEQILEKLDWINTLTELTKVKKNGNREKI